MCDTLLVYICIRISIVDTSKLLSPMNLEILIGVSVSSYIESTGPYQGASKSEKVTLNSIQSMK